MKKNTEDRKNKFTGYKDKGFTLVEILFSLFLISIMLIFFSKILFFSFQANKNFMIRFKLLQTFEYYKTLLLSSPFETEELNAGNFTEKEDKFIISYQIKDLDYSLKKINLKTTYKKISKKGYFYKSKFIKEVKNDQGT